MPWQTYRELQAEIVPGAYWEATYRAVSADGSNYAGDPMTGATFELKIFDVEDSSTLVVDASSGVTAESSSDVKVLLSAANTALLTPGNIYAAWLFVTLDGEEFPFVEFLWIARPGKL